MYYPDFLPHHQLPVLLLKEEYDNPKLVIIRFFEGYHQPDAVAQLKHCLKAAFSHRRLRRKELLSMMALKESLLRLLEVAALLKDEGKATIPDNEPQPLDSHWYRSDWHPNYTEWEVFPRHLSEKQYRNPYQVFRQCSKKSTLSQWRGLLERLLIAAAYCNTTGEDGCINYSPKEPNAYTQCKRLIELVEAAHLIYVREQLFADKSRQLEDAA